jgi:hypothetical protein
MKKMVSYVLLHTAKQNCSTSEPYLHLNFELQFLLLGHFQILLQLLNLHVANNLYIKTMII